MDKKRWDVDRLEGSLLNSGAAYDAPQIFKILVIGAIWHKDFTENCLICPAKNCKGGLIV